MSNDILDQVCDGLDMLNEDVSIPRNIRRGADEVKTILLNNWSASAYFLRLKNSKATEFQIERFLPLSNNWQN